MGFLFNDALNTFYLRFMEGRKCSLFNDALNTFTVIWREGRKCGFFNDAFNTFYLRLYGRKEMFFI